MKRNKGFTLIELLAVIVILAVIALIATPIVIGLIENSREGAFKSSLYNVFNAAEYKLVQDKNTEFPSEGIDVPSLSMTNNKFTLGTVYQNNDGMYLEAVTDGKYCGYGYKNNLSISKGNCETDAKWFTFDKNTGTIKAYNINGPKNIVIPRTIDGVAVTTIGDSAFQTMEIESIVIQNSVNTIEQGAFAYNKLSNIIIPNSVVNIGIFAFIGNQLPDSQAFIYNRNSDGSEDKTFLNSYGGAKRSNVIIPNGVIIIGNNSFCDISLESVVIPNTVTMIDEWAFSTNNLENVIIPDSVNTIKMGAFSWNQLTAITIPDTITTIEEQTFISNNLTSLYIPDSVTKIGVEAFYMNKLTSISIPKNVMELGGYAFSQNELTSVKIVGKSSSNDFTTYGQYIWSWATGYSNSNIIWNATE